MTPLLKSSMNAEKLYCLFRLMDWNTRLKFHNNVDGQSWSGCSFNRRTLLLLNCLRRIVSQTDGALAWGFSLETVFFSPLRIFRFISPNKSKFFNPTALQSFRVLLCLTTRLLTHSHNWRQTYSPSVKIKQPGRQLFFFFYPSILRVIKTKNLIHFHFDDQI